MPGDSSKENYRIRKLKYLKVLFSNPCISSYKKM